MGNIAAVVSHGLTKERRVPPKDKDIDRHKKGSFLIVLGGEGKWEHRRRPRPAS